MAMFDRYPKNNFYRTAVQGTTVNNRCLKTKIIDMVNIVGGFFEKYLKPAQLEKYKMIAGCAYCKDPSYINYRTLIGLKLIFTVSLAAAAVLLAKNLYVLVISAAVSGITGFFIPDILFKKIAREKSEEFNRDLPYMVDLLYLATLSGQNIYNSLKILVENHKSKASSELSVFLKEINSGLSRREAFNNIISRNNIENFKNLIFLLLQAEKYGSSINGMLKQKSRYLRFDINQKVEIRSRKTSIFLLFPLVFLILPAFVLLVGGPLIFSVSGSILFY